MQIDTNITIIIILFIAQLDLKKEKTAHNDLKQTWVNANNQFIELQAQSDQQLQALKQKLQLVLMCSGLPLGCIIPTVHNISRDNTLLDKLNSY